MDYDTVDDVWLSKCAVLLLPRAELAKTVKRGESPTRAETAVHMLRSTDTTVNSFTLCTVFLVSSDHALNVR